ncbi:hypothetical protein DK842_22700 [Chromobacterium phragmitis]|uniref:DotA/TraY family protein n=1 Tax=Chromobacterium phragmitis TaxID=2202141 RepID=UPI000DEC3114|nr:DotA/TraY family protein [Chromobacterium phragmitis]AXE32477.1 hypothetical protein DK842_22700 [Chromobacterium phragmitis]
MSALSEGAKGIGYVFLERLLGSEALGYFGIQASGVNSAPMTSGMALAADVALWFMPLITFYILGMGLLYSSQEGTVLGKRWSAVIVPLRGVGGLLFSAPVVPGGLSAIQIFVVGLGLLGNYIGNEAANVLAEKIYQPGSGFVQARMSAPLTDNTAKANAFAALTASEVCMMAARNLGYGTGTSAGGASSGGSSAAKALWGTETGAKGGVSPVTTPLSAICGNAQVGGAGGSNPGYPTDVMDCGATEYPSVCNAVQRVNQEFRGKVQARLQSNRGILADQDMFDLAQQYRDAMTRAINPDLSEVITKNAEAVKKMGWPGLGNFFQKYSAASGEFDNYIYHSANPKFDFKNIGDATQAGMALSDQSQMAFKRAANVFDYTWEGALRSLGAVASGADSTAARLVLSAQGVENTILRNMIFGVGNSAFDVGAMDAVQRLGIYMNVAGALTLKYAGDEASDGEGGIDEKSGETKDSGSVSSSLADGLKVLAGGNGMKDMLRMMAKPAMLAGLVLTTLLPSLPTIYFVLMTMEWVIWLIVAAMASPLWMIFHMLPDGDSLVNNRAETGWGLLAYIALFPLFVVLGFGAAMTLFNVAIPFAFEMMMSISSSSTAGATMDILFKPILMAAVVIGTTFLTMSLIISLPHRLATWINIHPQSDSLQEGKGQLGVITAPRLTGMNSAELSGGRAGAGPGSRSWMPKIFGKR